MRPADAVLAEARYRLAGIEYRAGRWTSARDLYARVLADHPGSAFVRDAVPEGVARKAVEAVLS